MRPCKVLAVAAHPASANQAHERLLMRLGLTLLGLQMALGAQVFDAGERLVYRAGFRLLAAGETVMEVSNDSLPDGSRVIRVSSRTRTDPVFDPLYKIRDRIDIWLDPATAELRRMVRDLNEGRYHRQDTSRVDAATGHLYARGDTIALDGPVFDPIGAIYHLRKRDLAVGDTIRLNIFDGRRLRLIAIRVSGPIIKKVPAGTFDCLALLPTSTDNTKLTKNGDFLRIWLSNDAHRIPIRIEQRTNFGLLVLRLAEIGP